VLGEVTLVGRLADGTPFSSATYRHADGTFPVYAALHAGPAEARGSLRGTMAFQTITPVLHPDTDATGDLQWFKPARSGDAVFPSGFSLGVHARCAVYNRPVRGSSLLSSEVLPDAGTARLTESGHDPIQQPFTIVLNGSLLYGTSNPSKLSLRFDLATGLFRGTFVWPSGGKSSSFLGVVFQPNAQGAGYFIDPLTHESGRVELQEH
jgi:hypothetical protein